MLFQPCSQEGTINTLVIDLLKAILSSLAECGSKLNKLGNYKLNKIEQERIIKYNSQFDVSMNERLLNRLTNRVSRRTEQLSRSKSIDSSISPYNSIDGESIQENIHEKIAKIRDTEGDKDFNKIRKEAQ
mmetsp:Transcript_20148/g.19787  ORF Transcript_20148/g.19787 Transcript_20148/m.19787 type:complete len:130 (-) Transcript_20148:348-737(-)